MTEEQQNELRGLLNELVRWSHAFGLLQGSTHGEYFYEGQTYAPFQVDAKQKEAVEAINDFLDGLREAEAV